MLILAGLLSLLLLYRLYLDYRPELNLLLHFNHKNEQLLVAKIRSHGWQDLCLLFLLSTLATAVPGMSNGIFCVLNGILYGPWFGCAVNWLADICGQVALLHLLRLITQRQQQRDYHLFQKLAAATGNSYFSLSLAYAIPIIPSVTVAYASLRMLPDEKHRLLPIIGGTLPASFIYAFGGDALLRLNWKRLLIFAACIIILISLDLLLGYWKHQHPKDA